MISFKTYTKSMLLVFCALFAMSLTSCKDQPNEYEIRSEEHTSELQSQR